MAGRRGSMYFFHLFFKKLCPFLTNKNHFLFLVRSRTFKLFTTSLTTNDFLFFSPFFWMGIFFSENVVLYFFY